MKLSEYIAAVVNDFTTANGTEVVGVRNIDFEVGVIIRHDEVHVVADSPNRIKFTLQVKRA